MTANSKSSRRRRRRNPAPMILPDDLYGYADDDPQRRNVDGNRPDARTMTVTDDWPEHLPVTDAEVDIFERYFGELLDQLFDTIAPDQVDHGLRKLPPDVNDRP